jgi:hypothetical protein
VLVLLGCEGGPRIGERAGRVGCTGKKNKTKRMEAWAARKMKKTKETLGRMGCFRELSPRGFNYFQNPFSGLNQILNGFKFE